MAKKAKFKVGDRVKITKRSEYYYGGSTDSNPKDVIGTVTSYEAGEHRDAFTTSVDWDNGTNNSYKDIDLELVIDRKTREGRKSSSFKAGDRVMISKTSQYYNEDGDEYNPINCYGRIANVFKRTGSIYVNWDNGKHNSYTAEDLEYPAGTGETNDTLTVDKEFVMHAYESACSSWKAKIENKFPELFPKRKFATLTDQTPGPSTLYYKTESGTYKSLEYNIALIDAIAGQFGVPKEAKYKGIYVNNRGGDIDNLEVLNTADGFTILFNLKD